MWPKNSHDKSTPIGIAFGGKVFVCSNLSFIGSHVIRRRHTVNAKRELPGLLMEVIEPLALTREAQAKTFARYQSKTLTDEQADHAILDMYRQDIIGVQKVADMVHQWDVPEFDWGQKTVPRRQHGPRGRNGSTYTNPQ